MRPTAPVLLLTLCVACFGAPSAKSVAVTEPPTLDGQLTEACWEGPAPIRDFVVLGGETPARSQTQAWVAHDADNLYVAVKAFDAEMPKLAATVSGRDANVFADDSVEIFLDPARDQFHYVQMAFNPLGTRFDASGDAAGGLPDWDGEWSVSTARGADHWSAEVAIPFATLPLTDAGETWGINICRQRKVDGELSCWSQTGDRFARPASFGTVDIAADLERYRIELTVADWGRGIQGRNALAYSVANRSGRARDLSLRLAITPPDEAGREEFHPIGIVPAGETKAATVSYQAFQQGPHDLALAVTDVETGRPVATIGRRIDVTSSATFSVFKSYYRDHVTVGYQVQVPEENLSEHSVTLRLRALGHDAVLSEAFARRLTAPEGLLRIPTRDLPVGQYEVLAQLTNAAGEVVCQDTLRFPQLRAADAPEPIVSVRDDNMLLVQGRPFFPLGIYERPMSAATLRNLSDAGFNLCILGGGLGAMRHVLDRAQAHGLHMWLPLSHMLDLSTDTENRSESLRKHAETLGDHPALLCWESIDEPAWGSQSAEGLYEGYCLMRELDPNRPIWMNHAPRNLISTLAHYNRGADIAGADIYPVPEPATHSNLPDKTIAVTGAETDKNREAVCDEKPIFMVLQGFGWRELSTNPEDRPKAIMPTFAQSRFMAYNAITHGANGLLYWGTHYTRKPSRFWSELKSLVSELASLQDVLASRSILPAVDGGIPEKLSAVRKSVGDRTFLIVVNESPEARTVSLTVPSLQSRRVRRLFEGQALEVGDDAVVRIDLDAYAVAVLSDDPTFADTRKDFSREWKDAPAEGVAPILTEPGNAIRNPGMEADLDDDQLPDHWSIREPFSVELVEGDAHSGNRAARLTNHSDEGMPLLIQNGVPLERDGSYRLSGWGKTGEVGTEFRIYVEWNVGDVWSGRVGPWVKGTGEWQELTVDFSATPDPQGRAYVVLQIRGKGTVLFDDIAVRRVE